MTMKNVLEFGFVFSLGGAAAMYIAESGRRKEHLEQLRIQNEKLAELIEQLRAERQKRTTRKDA